MVARGLGYKKQNMTKKKQQISLNWTLIYDADGLMFEIFEAMKTDEAIPLALTMFKAMDKSVAPYEKDAFEFLNEVEKYIKKEKLKFKKEKE